MAQTTQEDIKITVTIDIPDGRPHDIGVLREPRPRSDIHKLPRVVAVQTKRSDLAVRIVPRPSPPPGEEQIGILVTIHIEPCHPTHHGLGQQLLASRTGIMNKGHANGIGDVNEGKGRLLFGHGHQTPGAHNWISFDDFLDFARLIREQRRDPKDHTPQHHQAQKAPTEGL